jgi:Flp pilus assembly protein TadG
MRTMLQRLWHDEGAATATELALMMPVLTLLLVGAGEYGRMLLLNQKLQNGAFILADLAGRDQTLSEDQLDNIFLALNNLIEPFEFGGSGTAIVTSISGTASGDPEVNWQRKGAGTLEAESAVGEPGDEATLPETLTVVQGETVIVAEIYYAFEPLFGLTAAASTLHKAAYLKPRLGTLETLLP